MDKDMMDDTNDRFEELVQGLDGHPDDPPTILEGLSFPEYVPRLHADLGVAGSLRQRLASLPVPRHRRPLRVGAAVGLIVCGIVLAVSVSQQTWGLALVGVLVAAGGLGAGYASTRLTDSRAAGLHDQIKAEQRALGALTSGLDDSWVVLPDRLIPGTEVRVPAILVGPQGVIIVQLATDGPYRRASNGDGFVGANGTHVDVQVEELWDCQWQLLHVFDTHEPLTFTEVAGQTVTVGSLMIEVPPPGVTTQSLPLRCVSPEGEVAQIRLPEQAAGAVTTWGPRCLSFRQVHAMVSYLAQFGPPAAHVEDDYRARDHG